MPTSVNIKIGGMAGEGIKTTGLLLSKAFSRLGYKIFGYDEYPSLIRGGHNTFQVFADTKAANSQHQQVDILVAFNEETVSLHQDDLHENSLVITNSTSKTINTVGHLVSVPLKQLATESGGSPIMANMVALGATLQLCNLPIDVLLTLLSDVFKNKGETVISSNQAAVKAGENYILEHFRELKLSLELPQKEEQIVILGNEAIGLGAIAAGMKYFAGYPMTPASSIIHFLADYAQEYGYIVNHSENEIAAINTVIGASAAGIRAMTSTSGGGFALMVEGVGMAGIAEVPVVILLSMRPGPATGLPTWTGQADIRFAIHASQDEFPRLVLTPGDAFEAFELTKIAFELSEKYQLPALLLSDKVISESYKSGKPFESTSNNQRFGFVEADIPDNYQRYALTASGVSPRPYLGQKHGGSLIANSYEHDVDGFVTEEAAVRKVMMDKRLKKHISFQTELWNPPVFGDQEAKNTVIGFGSTLGPMLEALKVLDNVRYIHLNYVWPFPTEFLMSLIKQSEKVFCLEGNAWGQLHGLIREQTGILIDNTLRKYDGRPFYPEEIVEWIQKEL